jgi:hypothetical protein
MHDPHLGAIAHDGRVKVLTCQLGECPRAPHDGGFAHVRTTLAEIAGGSPHP